VKKTSLMLIALIGLSLLSPVIAQEDIARRNYTATGGDLLYEGYMNVGDYLLIGPLMIIFKETVYDINENKWKAVFLAFDEDMNPVGPNLTVIYIPDEEKVSQLLSNVTFLRAMAETLGYNPDDPTEFAQFLQWLSTADEIEIWEAIVKTIEEHPELGIEVEDVSKPYTIPNAEPIGVNETAKIEYNGKTLYITVVQVYPNGAKVSISGPVEWRVSLVQGLLLSKIEYPGKLKPGEIFEIKVKLKNIGARKVRFVTAILSPTPIMPTLPSSQTQNDISTALPQLASQTGVLQGALYPLETMYKYIDLIEPGEEVELSFKYKVNENARPGDYPIYLSVIYFVYTSGQLLEQRTLYDSAVVTIRKDYEAHLTLKDVSVPKIVHPGEDFNLTLTFENSGGDTAKEIVGKILVSAEPSDISMLTGANILTSPFNPVTPDSFYKNFLEPGASFTKTFTLHVNEDASTGTYPIKIKIEYYSGNEDSKISQEFTLAITVVRKREAFIEIENATTIPEKVEPGSTFTLVLALKNKGEGYAKGLEVKIEPIETQIQREITKVDLSQLSSFPIPQGELLSENLQKAINQLIENLGTEESQVFLPIGEDNVKYNGIVLPNQTVVVTFRLKANSRLESNIYPVKLRLRYVTSPDDKLIEDDRVVGVEVTGMERIIISKVLTSPSRVLPGYADVVVSFSVENVGSGEARYVILTPEPRYPFSLSETSDKIINAGTLRQGDSYQASFKVDVDKNAKPGEYKIPILVTYKDPTGTYRNITLYVPIIIEEKPNIIIENVTFNPEPVQGRDVNVYVTLKNIGGEKAENVIIEGVVKSSQPFSIIKRTDYVGNLHPNQTGQGVITLSISRNAIPKDYIIQIRIRAVGDREKGDDNVYTFEYSISIPVKENTETQSRLRLLATISGILAITIAVFIYLKRRSK